MSHSPELGGGLLDAVRDSKATVGRPNLDR
jgi:hypothetical protein